MRDFDTILLDMETQRDFFSPDGCCFDQRGAKAARNIRKLFAWARDNDIPVLSTVLRVRHGEQGPLTPRPHCIEDTEGEKKLDATILPDRVNLGLRNTTDLPGNLFERHQQVIVEKRDTDIFAHARLERLITELDGGTFIICGAGLAKGIVQAAVGLRSRGFGIVLAEDAVLDLDDPLTEMARLRMVAKSVVMAPTAEIVAPKPRKRPRYRPTALKELGIEEPQGRRK
jgi:nicotinamidase-related amidase